MRGVEYSVIGAFLAAGLHSPLFGQTPDAAQILTATRQALGGERKLSAVKTFVATGRTRQVRGNNLVPIEFEISCELPDRFVRKDEIPAQDTDPTMVGFNGDEVIQFPPPSAGRGDGPASASGRAGGGPPPNPGRGRGPAPPPRIVAVKQDFVRLPRINWKRTTLFLNYTVARFRNNTDGPFSIPSTGDLEADWGPANNDVRHRFNAALNNQIVRNLLMSFNVNANSGDAFTLLTGRDDNGDGIFNDRPAGMGRNTLRATGQATINMFVAYQFVFGRRTVALPPGIGVFGGGGAATVRTFDQGAARYRIQLFVQGQNLTNAVNYLGYSGTMTSPFFGKPTTVREMRKIDVGIGLNF